MIRVSSGSSGSAHWLNSPSFIWLAPARVTMSGRSRYCGSVNGPRPITSPWPERGAAAGSVTVDRV